MKPDYEIVDIDPIVDLLKYDVNCPCTNYGCVCSDTVCPPRNSGCQCGVNELNCSYR